MAIRMDGQGTKDIAVQPMLRLFVYGTLLRGGGNHHLLAESRCLGKACTEPHYRLVDLGEIPAMCPRGCSCVTGEVFEVTQEVLARIDALEGHPDWYTRTPVRLSGGLPAEAYLMAPEKVEAMPVIVPGDWREDSCGRDDLEFPIDDT